MAQPQWITESGNLGTITEGEFYRAILQAYEPEFPDDPDKLTYELISGQLPEGIHVTQNGALEGTPKAVASVQGVPLEVSTTVTSKFAIRIRSTIDNRINDRTFTLSVTGQDVPDFVTEAGLLGYYFDSQLVNYQLEFTDPDPDDTVIAKVVDGTLPPGVTLSTDGLLYGRIDTLSTLSLDAQGGYDTDTSAFDEYPFDFSSRTINTNYQFTVKISDGKDFNLRTFSIFVFSKDSLTADNTELDASEIDIDASVTNDRLPYVIDYVSNIGTYRHNNFFAYHIMGASAEGEAVNFSIESGSLPPGLSLDTSTGWIYGYISDISLNEIEYSFSIKVYKVSDSTVNDVYDYIITIIGDIETQVTWTTDADLGSISNGEISTFNIQAETASDQVLLYRLKEGGVYNKLPQGLTISDSGNIIGRVSFATFSLDGGTTTFDQESNIGLIQDETTFDREFTFTVNAYTVDGTVSVFKTFTIFVERLFDKPYQDLDIVAMPPTHDRELVNSLLQNQDIFAPSRLYRSDDPYYGVARKVLYKHAFGLEPETLEDYVSALSLNHYNKRLVLGEIKTARALDENDNVLYEVVYGQVVDNLTNQNGSVSKSVELPFPAPSTDGSTEITTVYPNSLGNMRTQMINEIGQARGLLPRWMLSKQEDGSILGYIPAWVLAYTKPGQARHIAYLINANFGQQLNKVDFTVDRYILEGQVAKNWDADTQEWITSSATTFDRDVTETTFDGGSLRFISNVDIYEFTNEYDKYLKFPQTRIIDNEF